MAFTWSFAKFYIGARSEDVESPASPAAFGGPAALLGSGLFSSSNERLLNCRLCVGDVLPGRSLATFFFCDPRVVLSRLCLGNK